MKQIKTERKMNRRRTKSFRKERLEREAKDRKDVEEFIASQKEYSTKEKAEQLIELLREGEEE